MRLQEGAENVNANVGRLELLFDWKNHHNQTARRALEEAMLETWAEKCL